MHTYEMINVNGGRIHLYKSKDFYHIVKKIRIHKFNDIQYVVKYFKFLSTFRSYIEQKKKENSQHQFNLISECLVGRY